MSRNPHDIIIKPIETEKSLMEVERNNCYTFKVDVKANKTEIRRAIEELFDVDVVSVNTIRMRGKLTRMGRFEGKKSDWKKAMVTIKPDQKIDIFTEL